MKSNKNEDETSNANSFSPPLDSGRLEDKMVSSQETTTPEQQQLDASMPTLFGLEKKNMSDEELQVPLFTGVIVLAVNLALIFYGFYVFFTGDDPAVSQQLF